MNLLPIWHTSSNNFDRNQLLKKRSDLKITGELILNKNTSSPTATTTTTSASVTIKEDIMTQKTNKTNTNHNYFNSNKLNKQLNTINNNINNATTTTSKLIIIQNNNYDDYRFNNNSSSNITTATTTLAQTTSEFKSYSLTNFKNTHLTSDLSSLISFHDTDIFRSQNWSEINFKRNCSYFKRYFIYIINEIKRNINCLKCI